MILRERLYSTAKNEIVREGDPKAAFLVGAAGSECPPRWQVKVEAFFAGNTIESVPVVITREPQTLSRDPEIVSPPKRRGRPPKV